MSQRAWNIDYGPLRGLYRDRESGWICGVCAGLADRVVTRRRHDNERGFGRPDQRNDLIGTVAEPRFHTGECLEERHRVGEHVRADHTANRLQDRLRLYLQGSCPPETPWAHQCFQSHPPEGWKHCCYRCC